MSIHYILTSSIGHHQCGRNYTLCAYNFQNYVQFINSFDNWINYKQPEDVINAEYY